MSVRSILAASCCLVWLAAATAQAQHSRRGLVSPVAARSLGLERKWFTQIELDPSRGRVVHALVYVSGSKSHTVYELIDGKLRISYSERDLDRFGDPLGEKGALRFATDNKLQLKSQGFDPKLEKRRIPEITLYITTNRATVHAIDAETGKTLWTTLVGDPLHPTLEPAANDGQVAVINGSNLVVLDRKTGRFLWQRRVGGGPGAGPALSRDMAFAPMMDGRVEGYEIRNPKRPAWIYSSSGRAIVQPITTSRSVVWPTTHGQLYVARTGDVGIRFRLEANDTIESRAAYLAPNRLFTTSRDGYCYSMHETRGDIMWRFSTGDAISHEPVAVEDSVYVVNDAGNLYRINAETGEGHWSTPRVSRFLAVSKNRVYAIGKSGRLFVIDKKTGGRIAAIAIPAIDFSVANWKTDRLYLGTKTGAIQCLQEVDAKWPAVYYRPGSETAAVPFKDPRKEVAEPKQPAPPVGGGGIPAPPPNPGGGFPGAANPPPGGGNQGGNPPVNPFAP